MLSRKKKAKNKIQFPPSTWECQVKAVDTMPDKSLTTLCMTLCIYEYPIYKSDVWL